MCSRKKPPENGAGATEAVTLRQGLTEAETEALLRWANAGGADFLRQFAGPKWAYPLTAAQVAAEAASIYAIGADGAFAGIVQVMGRQGGTVRIGRFLIDPGRAGRGIGTAALRRLCARLFEDDTVDAVALNVYRFNERALRCYRRCGFVVTHIADGDGPWARVGMALRRAAWTRQGRSSAPDNMTVPCGGGFVNLRVGAIIQRDGKLLMVKNPRNDYLYSVGGRIQFGETAEEAVAREAAEETGWEMDIDRLGFVHENYFYGDMPGVNAGKLIYEISFYFYMKVPDGFEPIGESFTDDGGTETLEWISPDEPRTIYPAFFRTALSGPERTVKHFVTDERKR